MSEGFCRHGNGETVGCERCSDLIFAGSVPLWGFDGARWEHQLRILPEFFEAVTSGRKTFEIRRDDRDFREADILYLREWDGEKFTGRVTRKQVTYITDFEQKPGFVVMGIGLWLCFRKRS